MGGVELLTLNEGRERGLRMPEFVTGSGLVFRSLVDRAIDVGFANYQGSSLGWLCQVGFPGPGTSSQNNWECCALSVGVVSAPV
jgi:hypothetical protein